MLFLFIVYILLSIIFLPCLVKFVYTVTNDARLFIGFFLIMANIILIAAGIHNYLYHIK